MVANRDNIKNVRHVSRLEDKPSALAANASRRLPSPKDTKAKGKNNRIISGHQHILQSQEQFFVTKIDTYEPVPVEYLLPSPFDRLGRLV